MEALELQRREAELKRQADVEAQLAAEAAGSKLLRTSENIADAPGG